MENSRENSFLKNILNENNQFIDDSIDNEITKIEKIYEEMNF